jgi:hypothetical protein
MEEDCGGGQGLTKGCGAKGRRRRRKLRITLNFSYHRLNAGSCEYGNAFSNSFEGENLFMSL